ncbi:MAG: hypothetical protein R2851_03275 [Caldilineaceae bacterium]
MPMDENRASAYFEDQSGTGHGATCAGNACPTVGEPGQRDGVRSTARHLPDAGDAIAELAKADFSIGAWGQDNRQRGRHRHQEQRQNIDAGKKAKEFI